MDIFIINTNNVDYIDEDLLKQFEHKKFSNVAKWREHCLAYLMLDRILREVYKISDRNISFKNGKPYLLNGDKHFSISHCKQVISIAFSDCDCGVDIEQIKQREYKKIAVRKNFNSNSLEEFYCDWTKYEAEYKLNGIAQAYKQFQYEEYMITAVSKNPQEDFEIYIQN